jgi:hypothetical protein
MRNNVIWVTFQKEGIHRYPDAVNIPGVEFLAFPHRHIFHFRVELQVFHEDRDLEFILVKRELESLFGSGTLQIDYKSCEMLANDVVDYLLKCDKYKGRNIGVTVSEDNELGATVTYIEDAHHGKQADTNSGGS